MSDYVDKPLEQAQNPEAKGLIAEITEGNPAAYDFLWRFWNFMHVYDDLLDRDKPVLPEEAIRELLAFVSAISFNPFYLENRQSLFTMLVMVCNRNLVGDAWKSGTMEQRVLSPAVRCGDLDLYAHVAYLCGGWRRMRILDEKIRTYDR